MAEFDKERKCEICGNPSLLGSRYCSGKHRALLSSQDCECGCGERTTVGARFIFGHFQKVRGAKHSVIMLEKAAKGELHPWNKGKTKDNDSRLLDISEKNSKNQSGKIPWNKGLSKETDTRVKKNAEKYPKNRKPKSLEDIANAQETYRENHELGLHDPPWNKGLTKYDDERLMHIAQLSSEMFSAQKKWNEGLTTETDPRIVLRNAKASESMKKRWQDEEYRQKVINGINSEEARAKYSSSMHKYYDDPEYIKKILRHDKPNMEEIQVLSFLQEIDAEWEFVGDKKLIIGRKNPDFVNREKYLLVEYNGSYWHPNDNTEKKIAYFAERGWNCQIIWDYEFFGDLDIVYEKLVELYYAR